MEQDGWGQLEEHLANKEEHDWQFVVQGRDVAIECTTCRAMWERPNPDEHLSPLLKELFRGTIIWK
jgi:hypothetical protein